MNVLLQRPPRLKKPKGAYELSLPTISSIVFLMLLCLPSGSSGYESDLDSEIADTPSRQLKISSISHKLFKEYQSETCRMNVTRPLVEYLKWEKTKFLLALKDLLMPEIEPSENVSLEAVRRESQLRYDEMPPELLAAKFSTMCAAPSIASAAKLEAMKKMQEIIAFEDALTKRIFWFE